MVGRVRGASRWARRETAWGVIITGKVLGMRISGVLSLVSNCSGCRPPLGWPPPVSAVSNQKVTDPSRRGGLRRCMLDANCYEAGLNTGIITFAAGRLT